MPWCTHDSDPDHRFWLSENAYYKALASLEGDGLNLSSPASPAQERGSHPNIKGKTMGKLGLKIKAGTLAKARETMGEGFSNVELEPGRHDAYVKDYRFDKTSNKIIVDFQVPSANGSVAIWYSMDDEKLKWLLLDLEKLGYDTGSIETGDAIEEALEDAKTSRTCILLKAKASGEYVNYKIEKILEGVTADELDAAGGTSDADNNAADPKAGSKTAGKGANAPKAVQKKAAPAKKSAKAEEVEEVEETEEEVEEADEQPPKAAPAKKSAKAAKAAPKEEVIEDDVVEDDAVQDDEVKIEPGLKCKGTVRGKVVEVEIVSVEEDATDPENSKVVVKTKDGKFRIPVSSLELE